ncbi:MAG: rpoE [Planctomycetaceae bacterium]|nr:rpoE [Planctomycetaceae bacterium]
MKPVSGSSRLVQDGPDSGIYAASEDYQETIKRWLPVAMAGSREALGRLLQTARPYLERIANEEMDEVLRKKLDPSDLVQQTFLEAIRDFSQFDGAANTFLCWMRRLLLNNLANLHRDFLRAKRSVKREVPLTESTYHWGDLFCSVLTPPIAKVMSYERNEALELAVARLPPDYQRVIQLRYTELLSFEAIADLMARSENAIRKLFARAIEQLYKELDWTTF